MFKGILNHEYFYICRLIFFCNNLHMVLLIPIRLLQIANGSA
jgi:hypothetical protein